MAPNILSKFIVIHRFTERHRLSLSKDYADSSKNCNGTVQQKSLQSSELLQCVPTLTIVFTKNNQTQTTQ